LDKIRVYYTNKTLKLLIIKALLVVGIKKRDKNKILVCSLSVYIMWKLLRINTQESWRHTSGQDGRRTGKWRSGEWRSGDYYAVREEDWRVNQETKTGVEKNKRKRM
jgi:hypothetical protein